MHGHAAGLKIHIQIFAYGVSLWRVTIALPFSSETKTAKCKGLEILGLHLFL